MGAPFWGGQTASRWDTLIFGTTDGYIVFPGVARVAMSGRYELKKGKAQGTDAVPVTDRGLLPRKLVARIKVWAPDDFQTVQSLFETLNIGIAGKPKAAYQLLHPQAEAWGIDEVAIEEFEISDPDVLKGMSITLKMLEVLPTKPAAPAAPQQAFKQTGLGPLPGQDENGNPTP